MVDHVSGAVFSVLTNKAVSDYVIKAMVASFANWSGTDIILKSDGEPSCKSIQGRLRNARSAPTIVQISPVGSQVGRVHDPGGGGSRPMPNSGPLQPCSKVRAIRYWPGLSHTLRCLAAHTAQSEEFGKDSALFAVWT